MINQPVKSTPVEYLLWASTRLQLHWLQLYIATLIAIGGTKKLIITRLVAGEKWKTKHTYYASIKRNSDYLFTEHHTRYFVILRAMGLAEWKNDRIQWCQTNLVALQIQHVNCMWTTYGFISKLLYSLHNPSNRTCALSISNSNMQYSVRQLLFSIWFETKFVTALGIWDMFCTCI